MGRREGSEVEGLRIDVQKEGGPWEEIRQEVDGQVSCCCMLGCDTAVFEV